MANRNRILLLIIIMTVIVLGVFGFSLQILYDTSFIQQRERLVEIAQNQACLMNAMASFDKQYSVDDIPGGAFEATLSQIRDAHEHFKGFGETGEFTLAKRDGNSIVFLLSHRYYDLENPDPVSFDSDIAEPMRRALSGESGTVIGLDYRGEMVLAAYEPVQELNLGIVAKIDLSEIRKPFINTGLMAGGFTLALIILGVVSVRLIGNPMVKSVAESEKKYHALFDGASDEIFIHDLDRNILEVNQLACEHLGYSHDELINMNVKDIDFTETTTTATERLEILMNEEYITAESVLVKKDGSTFPVEINARLIDYGGIKAVMSVARDITERKKTIKTLRDIEKNLSILSHRLLVATGGANIGIWDYDVVNKNLIWDDVMYKLYGVTPDTFGGAFEAWEAGLHPDEKTRGAEEIQMALRGEKDLDTEFRVVWPDKSIHYLKANATVEHDDSGKPVRMLGINQDMTSLKETEQKLSNKADDLETFNSLMISREMRVIELKEEINALSKKLGLESPYPPEWRDLEDIHEKPL